MMPVTFIIAADVLNATFPFLYADEPMARAIELLAASDAERLPVLESRDNRKVLGSVSKRRLLEAYREQNLVHAPVED